MKKKGRHEEGRKGGRGEKKTFVCVVVCCAVEVFTWQIFSPNSNPPR